MQKSKIISAIDSEFSLEKKSQKDHTEFVFPSHEIMMKVLGPGFENIDALKKKLGVFPGQRGLSFFLKEDGKNTTLTMEIITQLCECAKKGRSFNKRDLNFAAQILKNSPNTRLSSIFNEIVIETAANRIVSPKGISQKDYVKAIEKNSITFAIGPAGTGKTYLAVAKAVSELASHNYKRIVLTRPAVEAGERLGFLPGDLAEKVNPYLRPLTDALDDMLGGEKTREYLANGVIEIAPLAFMRGRTLNNCFVILDEAQNTTPEQMKMFLTRLGYSSKAVINGDVTQVDLPEGIGSGLIDAEKVLSEISEIPFIYFSHVDVVRHPLVQKIVKAYDAVSKGSLK